MSDTLHTYNATGGAWIRYGWMSVLLLGVLGSSDATAQTTITHAQVPTITNAGQGDLYITSDSNQLYIGISTGTLRIIGNERPSTHRVNDADNNTYIETEQNTNENKIRLGIDGSEKWVIQGNRIENANTNNSVSIGLNSGTNNSGSQNIFIGETAGQNTGSASNNTYLGNGSGTNNSGGNNAFVGYGSGANSGNGANNAYLGRESGQNNSGSSNALIGYQAGQNSSTAAYSVYAGAEAGKNAQGSNNIMVGYQAAINGGTGANNVYIGCQSAINSSGSSNTFLGYKAGDNNSTGSGNIVIGNDVDVPSASSSNQLNIGNAIFGTGMTGTLAAPAGAIGIGISAPTHTLHVNATSNPLRLQGLQSGATTDSVLTADAAGVVRRLALSRFVTPDSTTASNGLNLSGKDVRLGGNLTQATTITQSGQAFTIATGGTALNITGLPALSSYSSTDSLLTVSNGTVKKISTSLLDDNIYTIDGTLTGTRNVYMGSSNTLKWNTGTSGSPGNGVFYIDPAKNFVGIGVTTAGPPVSATGATDSLSVQGTVNAQNYTSRVQALASGSAYTWDLNKGANAQWTLSNGTNTLTITNVKAGMYGLIRLINSGSSSITLPSGSKVINGGGGTATLTQTSGAVDILTFYYDGSNYWWTLGNNYN